MSTIGMFYNISLQKLSNIIQFSLYQTIIITVTMQHHHTLQSDKNSPNPSQIPSLDPSNPNDFAQGRWTQHQHIQFLQGVFKFGKDWKKIDDIIQTRTSTQIRSHAQKYFLKFQKQQKERKKGKNRNKAGLTELEKELIKNFTVNDISKESPAEFVQALKKTEDNFNDSDYKNNENSPQPHSKEFLNEQVIKKTIPLWEGEIEEVSESSYLMKTLKKNPNCLMEGHDFCQLIDFGQINRQNEIRPEEPQSVETLAIRKRSFGLPDNNRNQEQLKVTLEHLHKQINQ